MTVCSVHTEYLCFGQCFESRDNRSAMAPGRRGSVANAEGSAPMELESKDNQESKSEREPTLQSVGVFCTGIFVNAMYAFGGF